MKKAIKRIKTHIKRWNSWRKRSMMSPWFKLLVLIGVRYSPTFAIHLTLEESRELHKDMERAIAAGKMVMHVEKETGSKPIVLGPGRIMLDVGEKMHQDADRAMRMNGTDPKTPDWIKANPCLHSGEELIDIKIQNLKDSDVARLQEEAYQKLIRTVPGAKFDVDYELRKMKADATAKLTYQRMNLPEGESSLKELSSSFAHDLHEIETMDDSTFNKTLNEQYEKTTRKLEESKNVR